MSPLNRFIKDGQNIAVLDILQTLLVVLLIKNDLCSCFFSYSCEIDKKHLCLKS